MQNGTAETGLLFLTKFKIKALLKNYPPGTNVVS